MAADDESREPQGERPRITKTIDLGFYRPDQARRVKRQADTKPEDVGSILLKFRKGKKKINKDGNNGDNKDMKLEQVVDEPDRQKVVKVEGELQQNGLGDTDLSEDPSVTLKTPQPTEISDEEKGPVIVVASGPIFVHDALPIPAQKEEEEMPSGKGTVVEVEVTQTENVLIEASLAEEPAEEHMDESFPGLEVAGEAEEQNGPAQTSDGQDDEAESANRPIIFPEDPQPPNPDPTRSLISERGMDEGYPISSGQDESSGSRGPKGTPPPESSIFFPKDATTSSGGSSAESLAREEEGPDVPEETTLQTVGVVPVIRDAMPEEEDMSDMAVNPEINEIKDTDEEAPEDEEMADSPEMDVNGMTEKPAMEDPTKGAGTDDPTGKPAMENTAGKPSGGDMTKEEAVMEDAAEKPAVDKTTKPTADATENKPKEVAEDSETSIKEEASVSDAKAEALSDPGTSQHSDADSQTGRQPLISQIFKGLFG